MIGDTDDPPEADDHGPDGFGCVLWLLILTLVFLGLALTALAETQA